MIKINDDFSITNDRSGWTVHHSYATTNPKTKEATSKTIPKYFATLAQSCNYVLDNSLKSCESITELLEQIQASKAEIIQAINHLNPNQP